MESWMNDELCVIGEGSWVRERAKSSLAHSSRRARGCGCLCSSMPVSGAGVVVVPGQDAYANRPETTANSELPVQAVGGERPF